MKKQLDASSFTTSRDITPPVQDRGAMADQTLDRLLKDLAELGNDRSEVPLRQLVRTLETRGYGPFLAVLAALMMLPLGAVP